MSFQPIKPSKKRSTLSEHDRLWNYQKGRCFYCGQTMRYKHNTDGQPTPRDMSTIEHLERRADGGQNVYENKRLACYDCNTSRGETEWWIYKAQKTPKPKALSMNDNPLADIQNICFLDTETRTVPEAGGPEGNLKQAGTYRYVRNAFVIVSTWAIADEPVWDRSLNDNFKRRLSWDDLPVRLKEFHKRVEQREAWYAAFNAGFDRNAINNGIDGFPTLEPDMFIDVMAQAVASNLPPNLEGSSKAITGRGKQDDGKALINLFCSPLGAEPWQRPAEWSRFVSYGIRDTSEMREVWRATRPLPLAEWEDYWVSEMINSRGVAVDTEFAVKANMLANAEAERLAKQLTRWTNGQITAVTQVQKIASWLYDNIPYAEAREHLVKEWDEEKVVDGDDLTADLKVGKLSVAKNQLESVSAFFAQKEKDEGGLSERDQLIYNVVQGRQFGGSTTPFKFGKLALQQTDDRLRGQYTFNGAQQTGRFSSKGVQIHNLSRATLKGAEEEAIEFINNLEI